MLRYLIGIVVVVGIGALAYFGYLRFDSAEQSGFTTIAEFKVDGNAEIIQAAAGGNALVYTNSDKETIDVLDISDPAMPQLLAALPMPGEPTSVGVGPDGEWAFAVVPAGEPDEGEAPPDQRLPGILFVIDLRTIAAPQIVASIGIGHQPDSVAVTRKGDKLLAVVAIENEPVVVVDGIVIDDEAPSQPNDISEPGVIQVIALDPAQPRSYSVTTVEPDADLLRNALMLYPDDPQPEYVALSPGKHLAAVSLQENNGIVLVEPSTGEIVGAFSLGKVANRAADLTANDVVNLTQTYPADAADEPLAGTRFPDAISFTPDGQYILSADEGEQSLTGGRGFSVWSLDGTFIWDDGGQLERRAAELGLYPDKRSDNKGIEVEGITAARFGTRDYAFVLSERGSFVAIYDIANPQAPSFVEIIPVGTGPESAVVIPERNLLVIAAEESGTLTFVSYADAQSN